tara:strand:- start:4193 stop:4318 length:126 start_codon:yes stop_codon:yes gene_type:complete
MVNGQVFINHSFPTVKITLVAMGGFCFETREKLAKMMGFAW